MSIYTDDLIDQAKRWLSNRFPNVVLIALPLLLGVSGCQPAETTEISAATSGFRPSDKKKQETTSDAKSQTDQAATAPNQASTSQSNPASGLPTPTQGKPVPTQSSSTQASVPSDNQPPNAPSLPNFEPGKLDPKIAAKDYMKLALGDIKEPKELVAFLEKCTRSLRELMADGQRKLVGPDLMLERGMELSRMKLQAAALLTSVATNDDEKALAALGRIEGLSQLTSFGDVISADELREVASQEINHPDPRVAQQAKSVSLSLHVADFQGGTLDADSLVAEGLKVLESGKALTRVNLNSVSVAIDALDAQSKSEAALQLAKATEEALRDSTEVQMALIAWQLHAKRIEEARDVESLKSMSNETTDAEKVRGIAEAFINKIDSIWTAFFIVKIAEDTEYSGRTEIAKIFIDVAKSHAEKYKASPSVTELIQNCEMFERRLGLIGKELDLSSVVRLDGQPIDMTPYKGKVVLVDFWATWCKPCLQEIPNIEATYKKLNKKGFEVIGINIDEDKNQLLTFFSKKDLLWASFVSKDPDSKGFNAPIMKENGIGAIPFIAVIGKDGKVAAIHVRGVKLEGKIMELLAKE